ncbi:hypothetical protein EDC32_103246 [Laceyella sacchari]|nr:hypothetical protein EDC32_103246 [Laceyella sacchari]
MYETLEKNGFEAACLYQTCVRMIYLRQTISHFDFPHALKPAYTFQTPCPQALSAV